MKKFMVTQECDYVTGYLRYGHFEGIIEANSLEEAKKIIEEAKEESIKLIEEIKNMSDENFKEHEFIALKTKAKNKSNS